MENTYHCECLLCGHRYHTPVVVEHNAGYDWADCSTYCPSCGQPNEGGSQYVMHDGPIPARPVRTEVCGICHRPEGRPSPLCTYH
jgi:hypothetical protein